MKKRIFFIATLVGMIAFTGCQRFDFDEARQEAIRQNAANIFGEIDPNQDWNSSISGTVTITADASLKEITRVQILTESPLLNPDTRVVAEANVQKGQTVTLDYDVLNSYTRLIAACVDSKGHYFIKGFDIGETNVSFKKGATTRAARRASLDLPNFTNVTLDFNNSIQSYNAIRAINNTGVWKGSKWDNDRLYAPTNVSNAGGSWTINNMTIYRDADALTETEKTNLQDIFNDYLTRDDKNDPSGRGRKNNLELIRNSDVVKLYNNELTSNGKDPITLRPVQMASIEAYWCSVYYYYYNPADAASSGLSEADYIKTLPKFKAIDLNAERSAFRAITGKPLDQRDENFLRLHEYLLPYYGDASEFTPKPSTLTAKDYTTNGHFYRIYNCSGKSDAKPTPIPASNHYITYGDNKHNLTDEGAANIEDQLWQVFTHASDNTVMLYNVGSGKFFWWNDGEYVEIKDITENNLKNYTIYISDGTVTNGKINPIAFNNNITNQKVFISSAARNNFIKALIDTGRSYLYRGGKDLSGSYRVAREWTFEDYTEEYKGSAKPISDFELPLEYFPATSITPPSTTPSATIPAGYKIGFMIRKDGGAVAGKNNGKGDSNGQGCLYGYGELNREINQHGQFKSAVKDYGMELNDPRIAFFEQNGKTYFCFEEGSDTQFSDVIVEMGGYDTEIYEEDPIGNENSSTGVVNSQLYDETEIQGASYMLLFEDRSASADYDMNDVVLRCQRYHDDPSCVELSLVAAGGTDDVVIKGIDGTLIEDGGFELNNKEVHQRFGVANATGYDRFVNTVDGKQTIGPRTGVYRIRDGMTIPQFLANIYIENQTTGEEVHVAKTGESPLAIIMPRDFQYPKERQSITAAYQEFLEWARDATGHQDWYNHITEDLVYPIEKIIN